MKTSARNPALDSWGDYDRDDPFPLFAQVLDITETKLSRSLDAVVEDCVNGVGVDLNTASVPLLARVSGVTSTLAENIVAFRDANGPYTSRAALKEPVRIAASEKTTSSTMLSAFREKE